MDRFDRLSEPEGADRYERLARKALSAYGLADARLTYRGTSTHSTFEVSTGDPARHYALRICPAGTGAEPLERETSAGSFYGRAICSSPSD